MGAGKINSIRALFCSSLKCCQSNTHPFDILRAKEKIPLASKISLVAHFQETGKRYTALPPCAETEKVHA